MHAGRKLEVDLFTHQAASIVWWVTTNSRFFDAVNDIGNELED